MTTDQVRIRSLYAGFYRTIIRLGLPVSGCVAVRSIFLLSVQEDGQRLVYAVRLGNGCDWSGSHLQTRQFSTRVYWRLKEGLLSVPRQSSLASNRLSPVGVLSYFGYLTGIVGTGIWGYRDRLLRLVSRAHPRAALNRPHEPGFAPCPRCCAGPISCRFRAVPMRARCENACGKLPTCRSA